MLNKYGPIGNTEIIPKFQTESEVQRAEANVLQYNMRHRDNS